MSRHNKFVYWQQKAGESKWHITTLENFPKVLEEKKPQFNTVLALDTNLDDAENLTYEDYSKVKYSGPFYADFDGHIEDVLKNVNLFMDKLESHGVRLDECEFSLTGGRGVHILVPMGIFMEKVNPAGYESLPDIYREMAYELAVDTMDMRVYSGKRGRMWRTYGVKRDNGKYKVQVTASTIRQLTLAEYDEWVSTPRPRFDLPAPTYTSQLNATYALKSSEVLRRVAARKKAKGNASIIAKYDIYESKIPPNIIKLMNGENIGEDIGFHQIAMQLAIFAAAIELEESDFLERCEGLCQNHQSNGNRYSTYAQRRAELARMHSYMWGNPCHEYSVGGIASLLRAGVQTADLDVTGLPPPETDEEDIDRSALHMGFAIRKTGIWKAISVEGETKHVIVCSTGMSNVSELVDNETLESKGFEVTTHLNGGSVEVVRTISNNDFLSRQGLSKALGSQGFLNVPDSQVGALQEVLKAMSTKTNKRVMTLELEGVNVLLRREPQVINQETGETTAYCVRWADANHVLGRLYSGEVDQKFRMHGPYDPDGQMKTDLVAAKVMDNTPENLAWMTKFLNGYDPSIMGRVLGWYSAAFLTQHLRRAFQQFPLLQSFGEAGSGKTTLNRLCMHLHYNRRKPVMQSAISLTKFAMEAPLASSGTIPVIFDEFKPREMSSGVLNGLMGLIRTNFDGTVGGKGKVTQDSGNSKLMVVETNNCAPMGIIAEALISQEAVLHRSICVHFPERHDASAESLEFKRFLLEGYRLGGLGRFLLEAVLKISVEVAAKNVLDAQELLIKALADLGVTNIPDRTLYAYAVARTGLRMTQWALGRIFEDENIFADKFEAMYEGFVSTLATSVDNNMSEINRVLCDLAHLSHLDSDRPDALVPVEDYTVSGAAQEYVEIDIKRAFDKYARYKRSQGVDLLFDTEEAFTAAILRHPQRKAGMHSDLRKARPTARVAVIDYNVLRDRVEGIMDFRYVAPRGSK